MSERAPWSVAIASAVILGLVVGVPYYGMPYFYDYFEGTFGWSRGAIMLGLPIGTLVTLIAGPLLVRKFPPRQCILWGAPVCAAALAGFGLMRGSLAEYYLLWILYMAGWTFAGPLSHQLLLTTAFQRNPGTALAVAYFGISIFGALSVACLARPITQIFGFRIALQVIGASVLLVVPIALRALPATAAQRVNPLAGRRPAMSRSFLLLLFGSTIAVGAIGGVSQHLKLIFREAGHFQQARLDEVFGWTVMLMLAAGSLGRFVFAWSADHFPRKHVITFAFVCMAGAMPLLYVVSPSHEPYLFAAIFGFGMSADFLLVPLLAADYFGGHRLAGAMSIIVPVNTVGQTWFPYLISLIWAGQGSYTVPLLFTFVCILAGRLALALLPDPPKLLRTTAA
jgi:Na+/melibiose symporter-like transporter